MKILFLFILIISVTSVNHNNFRTCDQSSFCRRANSHKQHFHISRITKQTETFIQFEVKNDNEHSVFDLKISSLQNGIFRTQMRHISGGKVFERFEPEMGLTLTEEGVKEVPMKITMKDTNTVELINQNSVLLIEMKDVKITMNVNGETVLVFNENNSLRFEVGLSELNGEKVDGFDDEKWGQFTEKKRNGPTGVSVGYTFPQSKRFFGIPEHATNVILKNTNGRNKGGYDAPYRLYNTDVFEFELDSPMTLYGSVPVVYGLSEKASAVFHHNPTETYVYVENKNIRFVSEGGILDEFFFPGPKPVDLIKEYLQVTGVAPMVPKYSLAYHQCRWNYMTQEESNEVIRKMDEAKIPFDVLWLDIEHTDDKKYFTWKKSSFPNPTELIDNLKKAERRLVTIVDPHIKKQSGYYVYSEAEKNDYLTKKNDEKTNFEGWCWPGNSVYMDFINPKVREWWATLYDFNKYQYSSPYQMIWIDMNEPSVFNGPETTMPKDNIHRYKDKTYEHREVHNIYGLTYHKATFDGLMKRTNGVDRPFILSRSFFAGSQKYGAVWTGDTDSTWEHLKASVHMTMNLNLVGILQSGGDVGGFFHNPSEELMVRWYQIGSFYPFFRAHAHLETKRREPYLYEGDTGRRLKEAIELRYKLIEYFYREYYLSVVNRTPMMKPMFIDYPQDENTYDIDNQFMAGNDILVTGVFESGQTSVSLYVPEGRWYNLRTNEIVPNGKQKVKVTMDEVPVYMRGGSVVPMKERKRRSSELMKHDPITLVLYADKNGNAEGYLYADDGLTTKKDHVLSKVTMNKEGIKCVVVENENGDKINVSKEIIKIIVVGMNKPSKMNANGRNVNFDEWRTKEMNGKGFVIRKPEVSFDKEWEISFN